MKSVVYSRIRLGLLFRIVPSLIALSIMISTTLLAQETDPIVESAEAPAAVTTFDPEIPVDQLALLVKPLTAEELAVEAAAWRDLLKAKVSEISQSRITVKRSDKLVDAIDEKNSDVSSDQEISTGTGENESVEEKAGALTERVKEKKQEKVVDTTHLIEQRTSLINRLDVVLTEWKRKGGDVESYRMYVTAVGGLDVDVSDASAAWTVVKAWLVSKEGGIRWFWNFVRFLAILFAFWILARIFGRIIDHALARWDDSTTLLRDFISKTARKAVVAIGAVVAVSALEVDVTPLLAAIGAAGLVVGLALQNTLSNFASGLLILVYRPFDTGDVVEAGSVSGKVESMNLLSTHIKTFDNKHIIVPNNDIWSNVITNSSASDTRRVDMTFGIGYDDDIAKAEEILTQIVTAHPLTLSDPEPTIKMNELADSSVNFICRPWSKSGDYWTLYWDVLRSVKEAFDREGISIPYPQQDIHVHQHADSTE